APRACAGGTPPGSSRRNATSARRWNAPHRYASDRPIAGKLPSGAMNRSRIAAYRCARRVIGGASSFHAGASSSHASTTASSIGWMTKLLERYAIVHKQGQDRREDEGQHAFHFTPHVKTVFDSNS